MIYIANYIRNFNKRLKTVIAVILLYNSNFIVFTFGWKMGFEPTTFRTTI